MPVDWTKYPKDWKEIRSEILRRANHRCEGSPVYPRCRVANGARHPATGSTVVLTIGHLDHDPGNNGEPGDRPNLRAWCQRCHLTYDARLHARNAAATKRGVKEAAGQMTMEEDQ